jgi:hypothetical protein
MDQIFNIDFLKAVVVVLIAVIGIPMAFCLTYAVILLCMFFTQLLTNVAKRCGVHFDDRE